MSKVIASEISLVSGSGSPEIAILTKDVEDAKQLIEAINSFIDSTKNDLTGAGYDAVRDHLGKYVEMLNARATASQAIIDGIVSGASVMSNHLGDESVVDTAELSSLIADKSAKNSRLRSLNYDINSFNSENPNGVSLSSLISERDGLSKDVEELDKKIERREKLGSVDNNAISMVSESSADVKKFENLLGGFSPIKY